MSRPLSVLTGLVTRCSEYLIVEKINEKFNDFDEQLPGRTRLSGRRRTEGELRT